MNREEHLQKIFPTKEGKTYVQSLDEFNSKSFTNKIMKEIETPEYKTKRIKENQEYLEKITMDFQLGYFVGEDIVHRFLPTLSTDMLQTRKVIKVPGEDKLENERLNKEWFETTRYGSNFNEKNENGDKEKWNLYYQHNKMLEKKYLPQTLETGFRLLRINDENEFKKGLRHSLWDCDMCSYNIEPENIKIENDMILGYTTITFQYEPDTDVETSSI